VKPDSGIWVLRGNLAPGGAVMKPSAASPELLSHKGKAVVFETIEDFKARIDDPDLDVDAGSILVLKGCGPKGYPGMPEVGNMPLPTKLLEKGVKDMVRISDARMSGTAFGTIVLHVTPEAAVGGPLAHVRNGDRIRLSVKDREIALLVSDEELAKRAAENPVVEPTAERGYRKLFLQTVTQADQGVDFDFLRAGVTHDTVPKK
jgi:dihydroxy-acid dehydratase